jgi:hypothetical protein
MVPDCTEQERERQQPADPGRRRNEMQRVADKMNVA